MKAIPKLHEKKRGDLFFYYQNNITLVLRRTQDTTDIYEKERTIGPYEIRSLCGLYSDVEQYCKELVLIK